MTQTIETEAVQVPTVGTYKGWPLERYLAAPGLSKHHLDYLRESPEVLRDYLDGVWKPKETEAMVFGRLLHALVLEGREDFVTTPKTYLSDSGEECAWSPYKQACKDWIAAQTKPVLTAAQVADIQISAQLVSEDKLAQSLLKSGDSEVSQFAKDEGVLIKSRPDWSGRGYFAEFKTTRNASTEAFSREIYDRRYHVQAAMNVRIARKLGLKKKWFFIILQKGDRPRLNVRRLRETDIQIGMEEIRRDLKLFRECEKSGNWWGFSGKTGKIEEITMPEWAHNQAASKDFALQVAGQTLNW